MLLKQYLQSRTFDHDHVFDGHDPRVRKHYRFTRDKPLCSTSAWLGIRRAFSQLRMDERYDNRRYFYHPQVFRVLCLALLKAGGYPSDWAEYLVGHSVGTQTHYLPPTEVLAREWLKLEDRFCFLTEPVPRLQENRDPPFLGIPTRPMPTAATSNPRVGGDPESTGAEFQTHRWSSQAWNYMKTNVRSLDYDEGLAQGYVIFDQDENGLRVLRKRRSPIGHNAE